MILPSRLIPSFLAKYYFLYRGLFIIFRKKKKTSKKPNLNVQFITLFIIFKWDITGRTCSSFRALNIVCWCEFFSLSLKSQLFFTRLEINHLILERKWILSTFLNYNLSWGESKKIWKLLLKIVNILYYIPRYIPWENGN